MSDYNSSLPVRTEQDGDVAVVIGDGLVPSQKLTVNVDGSVNVTDNAGSLTVDTDNGPLDVQATDFDIRDLVFATDKVDTSGSVIALDSATLAALESITVQNPAGAGAVNIQDGGNSITVDAVNLDIRDLAFATDKVDVSGSDITATVTATDFDIRDLAFATDKVDVSGSEVSLDAATLAALESITVQNPAGAGAVNIQDGGNSITVDATDLDIRNLAFATDKVDVSGSAVTAVVTATDLDIRDLSHTTDSIKIGDGTDFLAINPDGSINVIPQEDPGTEVVNFNVVTAVAGGASSNHDLVFATASRLYQVLGTASGRSKFEVQIETGSGTGTFNTVVVGFNSTATPDCNLQLAKYASIPAGARVRVIRTNRDVSALDLYSTIVAILG